MTPTKSEGWLCKSAVTRALAFYPNVPYEYYHFPCESRRKNLEKEVHCTKHFLKAFCVNFHNPLVLSNKAEEKDDGPVGYVQEDQLGSGPWLWGSPFTSTSPLAKLRQLPLRSVPLLSLPCTLSL